MFVDLITSEVKILRPHTSNCNVINTFQNGLRSLLAGSMIPGGQRPTPALSCLKFVPSRKKILLSIERFGGNSCTGGGASAIS